MKLISWNVNGLRACLGKGFVESMESLDPDIIAIQETKMQEGQADVDLPGYMQYFCSALILDYGDFYFVNVYVPNAQDGLKRIDYRMKWEDDLRGLLCDLDREKPVILCGDMNVAHEEIDLKNPKTNRGNAGFSDEERGKMTELLGAGFTDTFRYLYPDAEGIYSWWSYRFNARKNNAGWRIDYFIVSNRIADRIKDAKIHTEIFGSDHCPVELEIEM